MDQYINIVLSNPLYLAVAIIVGALLVFAILKRLARMLVTILIIIILYIGYLAYTGQEIPGTKEQIIRHGTEQLDRIKTDSRGALEKAVRDYNNIPEKKAEQ